MMLKKLYSVVALILCLKHNIDHCRISAQHITHLLQYTITSRTIN